MDSGEYGSFHLGKLVQARLREMGMAKSEFARRIGKARQNINDILKKRSMDTELLVQISNALGYNFFQLYGQELDPSIRLKESPAAYGDTSREELFQCQLALKEMEKKYEVASREAELLREIVDLYKQK